MSDAPTTPPDFTTAISRAEPGFLSYRGYLAADVIAHATASEAAFLIIRGRRPTANELRVFDAIMCSAIDHGLVSAATVAARYVVSGSAHLPGAMAAGILAFGQHTGTANLTAEFLLRLADGDPAVVDDATIRRALEELRSRREAIPGLGHPIHKEVDPRTIVVREVATDAGLDGPYVQLLDRMVTLSRAVVGRELVLNVDGLMGALFLEMGFTPDEMLAVNILGAMPGIAAHAIEEMHTGKRLRYPRDHVEAYQLPRETRTWDDPAEPNGGSA